MVYGALPLDRFGTDAQRKTWLSGVASGETILTAAMAELVGEVVLPGGTEPATTATAEADGSWVLSGTKACVPAALVADAILVPATCRTADGTTTGPGVFIVERDAEGVDADAADDGDGTARGDRGARRRARRRRPARG